MNDEVSVPRQRAPEREVGIRELRNAGKVVADLAEAGAVGRLTSGGRLVGWLLPASPDDQLLEELTSEGRLLPADSADTLADHRPLPRRTDVPPLSETLERLRADEGR